MLLFRLFGAVSVAAGLFLVWFARASHESGSRFSKYEMWVSLLVTGLIGLGLPFLLFGAPTFESPGGTQ
jgi:hypothetical protein